MNKGRGRFRGAISTFLVAVCAGSLTIGTGAWQSPALADSNQVIGLNNDGVKALNTGNFPLAVQKFQAALTLDPNYQLARDNLAIAHNNYGLQQRNNPKAALKEFHQALYLNPSNSTTQANVEGIIRMMGKNPRSFADRVALGEEARHSGDFIGAIIEFSEALKIKDDPKIHESLGMVYRVLDKNDQAITEFKNAITGGSDNANLEVKLGQAYQAKGDLPSAIGCYAKAISFKSDDPEVLDALVTGWKKALDENPLAPENHIGLGQAFQYSGDFGQARGEYRQALSLAANKSSPVAQTAQRLLDALPAAEKAASFSRHVDRGLDLQTHKLYDQAIDEYRKALEADPSNAGILVNIGSAYQAKGDLQNALTAYSAAAKLDGNNQAAKEGVKTVSDAMQDKMIGDSSKAAADLFKLGRYDDAIAKYQEIIKINPKEPGVHFDLGATYQAKKDFDDAISEYRTAILLDPQNDAYKKALATAVDAKVEPIIQDAFAKFKAKDYAGAIAGYQQAIVMKPDNAGLWFNIASAEYQRQNYPGAKEAYQKALSLDRKGQINDLYFIGTIDENAGRGNDAIGDYQRYLAEAPNGTYLAAAKNRLSALNRNPADTQKIKSESELTAIHDAEEAYTKAVQLQQAGKFDEAIPLYQKATSTLPQEPSYAYGFGTCYQAKQDYDNAMVWYQKAMSLDPKNKDYPRVLEQVKDLKAGPIIDAAVQKQTSGDPAGAIAVYQQALQISPKNARLLTDIGTAYQQTDRFQEARDAYQKAYDLDNVNEVGDLYLMGPIDENFNQGSRAIQDYTKYLQQAPKGNYAAQAKQRLAALQANPTATQKLTTQADAKQAKAAQDAYDQGVKLQGESKFDDAIASYMQAISINPKEPAFAYALGTAYQGKGDMDNATTSYQKAVSLTPQNNPQYKVYQKAYSDAQILKAQPIMDAAIQKQVAKDYQGAIDLYQKALAIDPTNARGFTNLASAFQAADNYRQAHTNYEKALQLDATGESDDWYFLALLDENDNAAPRAIQDYQHYLVAKPKGSYAAAAQARISDLRAHPGSVQKLQTTADVQKSSDAQAAYDAAIKLQTDSKFDDAIASYKKAIGISPNEGSYYYGLGTAYQGLGATKAEGSEDYRKNFDLAIENYKKAVSLSGNSPDGATYKGTLLAAQQALAAPLVNSAIKKQTTKDEKGGYDYAGAIADYEAALRLAEDPSTLMNLGTAYQAMGNNAKAVEVYKRSIQLDPKLADAHYFLGTVDETLKQNPAAIAEYRRYLQLQPAGQYAADVKSRLGALAPGRR